MEIGQWIFNQQKCCSQNIKVDTHKKSKTKQGLISDIIPINNLRVSG
jgi:hypothetical protein